MSLVSQVCSIDLAPQCFRSLGDVLFTPAFRSSRAPGGESRKPFRTEVSSVSSLTLDDGELLPAPSHAAFKTRPQSVGFFRMYLRHGIYVTAAACILIYQFKFVLLLLYMYKTRGGEGGSCTGHWACVTSFSPVNHRAGPGFFSSKNTVEAGGLTQE